MVDRIRQGTIPHFYIKEWREHRGLTHERLGERCGVARNTVWRWENEQHRLKPATIGLLAHALDTTPESLQRPPLQQNERPSLDEMVRDADDDLYQTVHDIVARLTKRAS